MPVFTTEPPPLPDGFVFRILRTPAKGTLQAIVTCTDVIGTNTHFVNNRTIPCEGQGECPHCHDGFSKRWHGYVSCMITANLEHVLFEFTAHASDTFRNYYKLHNTMRACLFRATRPSGRHNGRVIIHTAPGDESRYALPDPPDIKRLLCHIWNVRYDPNQSNDMGRVPFRTIAVGDNGQDGRYRRDPDPAA
jgi:hypothetical protein